MSTRSTQTITSTTVAIALAAVATVLATACSPPPAPETAPLRLAETGLWADPSTRTVARGLLPFSPQYPLWTDGATKQRWISLPPGTSIDASRIDDWNFPIGTRLWKQFSFADGVETRFMQRRRDGSWLYASYVRTPDGEDDVLAPSTGIRGYCATLPDARHDVPSVTDCRLCHENGRTPVLGFSALQLSGDRDPLAPHAETPPQGALDLAALTARGLVRGLPTNATTPRIAARTPTERAALGWLHGNCSSCHHGTSPLARLGLRFDVPLGEAGAPPALATTIGRESTFVRGPARWRIAPGRPEHSVVRLRAAATDPLLQMPPFGRHLADADAVRLLDRWIDELAAPTPLSSTSPNHHSEKE
jgi:hypothetical protein